MMMTPFTPLCDCILDSVSSTSDIDDMSVLWLLGGAQRRNEGESKSNHPSVTATEPNGAR